jgi:hypothetical protein
VKDKVLKAEEKSWPVVRNHPILHLEELNKITNNLWVETPSGYLKNSKCNCGVMKQ